MLSRIGFLFGFVLLVVGVGVGTPAQGQTPLSVGAELPDVGTALQRLEGTAVSPRELAGTDGTVFIFWSNECPWVDKYQARIEELVSRYEGTGVQFVLVNANDATANPAESRSASRKKAEEENYTIPYVRDPNAAFARALGASRTPQAYVFGPDRRLVYVGAIDDSPGNPSAVKRPHLQTVVEAIVNDQSVPVESQNAFGCTLKYPN